MDIEQLGERVSLHPTDNDRRRRTAVGILVVAAVALGIGVPLSIWHFTAPWGTAEEAASRRSFSQFIGGVTALGVMALVFGIPLLVKALRTRGEAYSLHERGVVHRLGEAVTVVGWGDVVSVRARGVASTRLAHALGTDFTCVVRLADGGRLRFNGYTENAAELAAAIEAGVDQASSAAGAAAGPDADAKATEAGATDA